MHRSPTVNKLVGGVLRSFLGRGLNAAIPGASERPHSEARHKVEGTTTREASGKSLPVEDILYPRGPISGLPEEFESRRERFAELDSLESGWTLELRKRKAASVVEAIFFSPSGNLLIIA